MSTNNAARRRNEGTRTLGRYHITEHHPYSLAGGGRDWSRPVYRVRPKGFETVLFTFEKLAGTSEVDFTNFMRAVQNISSYPVPEKK